MSRRATFGAPTGMAPPNACPAGSACVAHDDGKTYCFLICTDKPQCNLFRAVEVEANCSSSVTFIEGKTDVKACVPPSG